MFLLYSQLMSIGSRRPPPRKIIMNVSVNDDVQLKKSENAWKPGMKREGAPEDPEIQKTQVPIDMHSQRIVAMQMAHRSIHTFVLMSRFRCEFYV